MYYYLMGALKRKVIREVKDCFTYYFPQHQDIVEHVNHKYAFTSRPQKGIVVTNANATALRLSADNFQGTVSSYVMLTGIPEKAGLALEWIKEDANYLHHNSGVFPTAAGIYYIEVTSRETLEGQMSPSDFQLLLDTQGDHDFYFWVDPLITAKNEPVATLPTNTGVLLNTPLLESSLRLKVADGVPLEMGTRLVLTADQSLTIGPVSNSQVSIGLDPQTAAPLATGTNTEPFNVLLNVNDTLEFVLDGTPISVLFTQGLRTADQIVTEIRNSMYQQGVAPQDIAVARGPNGTIQIPAEATLSFGDPLLSTANTLLGFTEGFVSPVVEGYIFPPYALHDATMSIEVDGVPHTFTIYKGHQDTQRLAQRLSALSPSLTAVSQEHGDYTVDPVTGAVEILAPLPSGTVVLADYHYPAPSEGPWALVEDHSNNKAIPGVVLAFGKQIKEGDKQAVLVFAERDIVASEYGGRWEVTVDLDIITRDPMTREEISDHLLMYFFAIRKEGLTEEGLEITDVTFGGEIEETYDDNAEEYYFNSSISISFQTDWAIQVPHPLTIERVTPTTAKARGLAVQTEAGAASNVLPLLPQDLLVVGKLSIQGKNSDFEDID